MTRPRSEATGRGSHNDADRQNAEMSRPVVCRNTELLFLGHVVVSAALAVLLTSTTGQRTIALAIVGLAVLAGVVLRMMSEELPGWPPRRRSSSSFLTTVVLLVLAFGSALLVSGGSALDHLGAWVAGFAAGITLASPIAAWMDWQRWVV